MSFDIDLIIFDCDGTLVDSEYLNCISFSEILNDLGLQEYSPDKISSLFKGKNFTNSIEQLKLIHDVDFPGDLNKKFVQRVTENLPLYLKPVDGALETVSKLSQRHKICVGSNGEFQNIVFSLSHTGLQQYFPEQFIFNAAMVDRAKPDPDLFLHACKTLNCVPEKTLVIEDTATGVHAAVSANMHVIGFTGTAEDTEDRKEELKSAGADIIVQDLKEIINHIKNDDGTFHA